MENVIFDQQAQVFNSSRSSNKVGFIATGEKAVISQHSRDSYYGLESLRHKKVCDMMSPTQHFFTQKFINFIYRRVSQPKNVSSSTKWKGMVMILFKLIKIGIFYDGVYIHIDN